MLPYIAYMDRMGYSMLIHFESVPETPLPTILAPCIAGFGEPHWTKRLGQIGKNLRTLMNFDFDIVRLPF